MNSNDYLLTVLLGLQLVGCLLLLYLWLNYNIQGLLVGVPILLLIDFLMLKYVKSRKANNNKKISKVFGDIIGTGIVFSLSVIVSIIVFGYIGYKQAHKKGLEKMIGVSIPVLETAILLGSLFLVDKI